MAIPRGATPPITCILDEDVLGTAEYIYLTLEQGDVHLRFEGDDLTVDGQTVTITLTQEQSLMFRTTSAEIQLNWVYPDGTRGESEVGSVYFSKTLEPEVLPDAE